METAYKLEDWSHSVLLEKAVTHLRTLPVYAKMPGDQNAEMTYFCYAVRHELSEIHLKDNNLLNENLAAFRLKFNLAVETTDHLRYRVWAFGYPFTIIMGIPAPAPLEVDSDRPQLTEDELKKAITDLSIETGEGLWKKVVFEKINVISEAGWYASESTVGSGTREIIYCDHTGLAECHDDLINFKAQIDSGMIAMSKLNSAGRSAVDNDPVTPIEEGDV
jgi:hypothetical protein